MEKLLNKEYLTDRVVALGGNPNVGKSTVFNELTGLRQHTGNWAGKTVVNARGYLTYKQKGYVLIDLPGCYSLTSHTAEEDTARSFIRSGIADAVVIVCDATCLERSLCLVLQSLEMTPNVVVCVNLMDEARKKKILVEPDVLSQRLGVPVVAVSARKRIGLDTLMQAVEEVIDTPCTPPEISYPDYIKKALSLIEPCLKNICGDIDDLRWLALSILRQDYDECIEYAQGKRNIEEVITNKELKDCINMIWLEYAERGINTDILNSDISCTLLELAENICAAAVVVENADYKRGDAKIDSILSGKKTAFPIMTLSLLAVLWLTISGANYPSRLISDFLFWLEVRLFDFLLWLSVPLLLSDMLIFGVYRVLAWVVSVMLPPMAIFFPLFTLMEDVGVLPRIAFNLDKFYQKCNACGKQALTMCMG